MLGVIDSGGALPRLYLSYPLIHLHKDEDNIRKSGELRAVSAVAAPGSNYSILLCPVDSWGRAVADTVHSLTRVYSRYRQSQSPTS